MESRLPPGKDRVPGTEPVGVDTDHAGLRHSAHLIVPPRGHVDRVRTGVRMVVPPVVAEDFEHALVAVELQGPLAHPIIPLPPPEIETGLALCFDQIADDDHPARDQRREEILEQAHLCGPVEVMDGEG